MTDAMSHAIEASSATADEPPGLAELVARAIEEAGLVGYSLDLTRLVDGVATFTLTYTDGSGSFDFESDVAALEHVRARCRLAMAHAALRVVTGARQQAQHGPWKVVISDWGYPNILPAGATVLAADSVAEFHVRRGHPDGRERAKALAEHFVAVANAHAAAEAFAGRVVEGRA